MDSKIKKEDVLFVEGKDEINFFGILLKWLDITDVQIIDVGGKDNFQNRFSGYMQTEGALSRIKNIGFVRDAEGHEANSAFQSICSVLKKYELACPNESCKPVDQDNKKISIFIMPNNNDCGMLEDLCIRAIQGSGIFPCVESFIQCYEGKIEKDRYNKSRAIILAYLSTQIPIVNSLGLAAQQNIFDFSNPCFDAIRKFLIELYN
jgi:hypothetical protein